VVKALDHYHSYVVATQREETRYKALERLQRKPQAAERPAVTTKKKKA